MDPEQIVAELEENAEDLETDANPQGTIALARVSEEIAWTFGVRRDEVAILVLVEESKHLQFLIPEKLKGVGTIPLTSMTSLPARTARDKRPESHQQVQPGPTCECFRRSAAGARPRRADP